MGNDDLTHSEIVPADLPDLSTIPLPKVGRLNQIRGAVQLYLASPRRSLGLANGLAAELGISRRTFFRKVRAYRANPSLVALGAKPGRGGPGQSRLRAEVDAIVDEELRKEYLSLRQKPLARVYRDIRSLCIAADFPPPSRTTVRRRSLQFGKKEILRARKGSKAARDATRPVGGPLEVGRYPLDLVQIDHTPADAWIVDQVDRQPLARPLVTAVLDTYSRAIIGLALTLERGPNALQTAIAVRTAVLPKGPWLAELDLAFDWPMFGLPNRITTDNGADFTGTAYASGCERYNIICETRQKGHAESGGHIESGVRVINNYIQTLPGGVRSQQGKIRDYDPKKHASLTLKELERAVVGWIVGEYNNQPHSATRQTPATRFLAGLKEAPRVLGEAFPRMPEDIERFQIDFLPIARRTLQKSGIQINGFTYSSDNLRPLIERRVGDAFLVRYDPRDISYVYVYVREQEAYLRVFAREADLPSSDLWTARETMAVLRRKGVAQIDERMRINALKIERQLLADSVQKTRSARRRRARIEDGSSASRRPAVARPTASEAFAHDRIAIPEPARPPVTGLTVGIDSALADLKAFDDVELL